MHLSHHSVNFDRGMLLKVHVSWHYDEYSTGSQSVQKTDLTYGVAVTILSPTLQSQIGIIHP